MEPTIPPKFLGRRQELADLRRLLQKKSASLIVIRGRRRIGKSRLVQEFARELPYYTFSGLPPTPNITAQDQRETFARQLQEQLKIPLPRADDWSELFHLLASHTKENRLVILLDEISWMGSKDRTFLGKLKIAWDVHFKNNPQLILVLCGSVSTWIERNIISHTGFLGRISLTIVLEELPLRECNLFWQGSSASAYDKFKLLSVLGGIPRYLEEIIPSQSAETTLQQFCFRKGGFLVHEFNHIFTDLFSKRRGHSYQKIARRLASGPATLEEIYDELQIQKSGVVSDYMKDLILSGFVSQDRSWNFHRGTLAKGGRFRLRDNYIRFYLKYIEPNLTKIEQRPIPVPSSWTSILGLQFENLVLNNRELIHERLSINPATIEYDNPYFQPKKGTKAGCQVDYLIQDRFGSCYLCEIKFSLSPLGAGIIPEIQKKIDALDKPEHLSVRPVLIHVNGVLPEVAESDFFAAVIDFKEFLNT